MLHRKSLVEVSTMSLQTRPSSQPGHLMTASAFCEFVRSHRISEKGWSTHPYQGADSINKRGEKPKRLEQDLVDSFRTNVVGNVHLFNLALPLVLRGHAKKVVTVSSGMADLDFISKSGIEVGAPYSISKAALNTAVAKFSAEHSHQGILFFSISPGVIDTGLYDNGKNYYLSSF